MLGVKTSIC